MSRNVALRRGYMLSDFPNLCHTPGNVKCMSALIPAKGVLEDVPGEKHVAL